MKYREKPRPLEPQESESSEESRCDLDDIIFRDECWLTSDR